MDAVALDRAEGRGEAVGMASASSCSTPEDRFGALASLLVTSIAAEPVEVAAFAFCD